jgi:uncharacterized protein (DUF2141 family)
MMGRSFQFEYEHEVIIELTNLRSTNGKILASIYDEPETFPKTRNMMKQKILDGIPGEKMIIQFDHLSPGTYAIAVMHDENGDEKMNFNLLGFPKEGYCFSNNVRPHFRKPTWEEAKFELDSKQKHIQISMKY